MRKFLWNPKLNANKTFNHFASIFIPKTHYINKWSRIVDPTLNSFEEALEKVKEMKEKGNHFQGLMLITKTQNQMKLNQENALIMKEMRKEMMEKIKSESFLKSFLKTNAYKRNFFLNFLNNRIHKNIILLLFIFSFIYLTMTDFLELAMLNMMDPDFNNDNIGKTKEDKQRQRSNFSFFRQRRSNHFKLAENVKERLADVKGIDEVRDEIEEVIKMLKNPDKYENAGAKLIRGILLIGKPGTGKTLLARALAGESGVNFIYVAASEFDKSLVGMGNKLVKKLFQMARENQPCIIFIDEIDTLLHSGRRNGKFSTSFERSLINTFLAEMDGFQKRDYLFVLGATNSEKDLDKASLRPGRFDKILHIPLPDKIGRKDIFDLYLKKINLPVKEISPEDLSQMTPGFTGAEIENMVNTAVINAVDVEKDFLDRSDFENARDRIVLGIKRPIRKREKQRSLLQTAVHEAGHTLVCFKDKFCRNGIHKVTIIPRGDAKGKTSTLIDDIEGTKEEFLSMIDMSLAGYIAEEIYFGKDKVSVGCGNDLNRATSLAKSMVKQYAMDNQFGYMVVDDDFMVSHRISSETRNKMDQAVDNILKQRTSIVKEILNNNVQDLKNLSQKLVEYEELNKTDIENILSGGEPKKGDSGKKREFLPGALAI